MGKNKFMGFGGSTITVSKGKSGFVAKSTKKYVKKQLNKDLETKYSDIDVTTPFSIDSTGTTLDLQRISTGALVVDERIGSVIRVFRIEIRGQIVLPDPVNMVTPQTVRVILFRDNIEGTQDRTVLSDVLETGLIPCNQQYQYQKVGKGIQVLYDRRFVLDAQNGPRIRPFYINIKKPMLMKWNTGAATSEGKGRCRLALISDEATTALCALGTWTSRTWYKDG